MLSGDLAKTFIVIKTDNAHSYGDHAAGVVRGHGTVVLAALLLKVIVPGVSGDS